MQRFYKPWDTPSVWGDVIIIGYVLTQCLDGVLTYLGVTIWGVHVEANPLISSAMAFAGLGGGLVAAKMVAIGFGMVLHLRRVHTLVALLTMFYVTVAIVPWTALFLTN